MADLTDLKSDYNEFWRYGKSNWNEYWTQANIAQRAAAGQSWRYDEAERIRQQKRDPLEFNIIKPYINLFSGYARDNIKSTVISPQEEQDQQPADDSDGILQWVYTKDNIVGKQLNSFDMALNSGISLVGIYMDYTQDLISGDIKSYVRPFNTFVLDPLFTDISLSDCSQVIMRDFVTRDQAKSLIPQVDDIAIEDAQPFFQDEKFRLYRPRQTNFSTRDILALDWYYRQTTRRAKILIDLESGEQREFKDQDINEDDLKEFIQFQKEQNGMRFDIKEVNKPTIELGIFLSGEPVWKGPDPTGLDEYPFVPTICYFYPYLDDFSLKLQGISHGLLDLQRTFNRREMRNLAMMDKLITSGFIYKPSKVVDQSDFLGSGFQLIAATEESNINQDIVPISQGSLPSGWLEFTQTLPQLGNLIAGVNDSMNGQDQGGNTQVSGRLAEVRAAQGLRANRSIFDNFERSQMLLGKKILKTIQKSFTQQKVQKIIGREPDQRMFDPGFDKFDVIVKQNVLSQSQRDAYYFELIRLIELFGPDPVLKEAALEALPMQDKSQLLKKMEEQSKKEEQQAREMQEEKKRLIQLQESSINEKNALAQERRARAIADIGLYNERKSELRQNIAQAQLDRAKAVTEIAKLNDDRMIRLLEFIRMMEEQDQAVVRQEEEEDIKVQSSLADDPTQTETGQETLMQSLINPEQGGL